MKKSKLVIPENNIIQTHISCKQWFKTGGGMGRGANPHEGKLMESLLPWPSIYQILISREGVIIDPQEMSTFINLVML